MATGKEKFDVNTCLDLIGIQDYLKRLRALDDSIITNLNTVFVAEKDDVHGITTCDRFHKQLKDAYQTRDKVIHFCLNEAEAQVATYREASQQNQSDSTVQKEFKRNQTRMRMLQKELTVEQIIQERSLKALQERCRRYVNF